LVIDTLDPNVKNELEDKSRELYGRLDPSIRHHLQKRGISIKENIYIGFDTEFTRQSSLRNKLISAQLAVSTRTYVQIPIKRSYKISSLDVTTNKLKLVKKDSKNLNYSKIETSIQICIDAIRSTKYKNSDAGMLILNEGLRLIKGMSYNEKDDYITFALPRSVIQPYFQICDSFSMADILKISSSLAKPYFETSNKQLMKLIENISPENFNLLEGKEKLVDDLYSLYGDYTSIEEIGNDFDKPLALIPYEKLPTVDDDEKRLTRQILGDIRKISITKTRCSYIIAHLTQADLSLLSDFSMIKEELSIVNGSFVTIGKPIKYMNKNVHIRDTMLLAPGSSKSLASIGSLYSIGFNKIKISKFDLEDMQGFLIREEAKFTEYALRDALISLIHGC
jgi:hypothetical protein